MIRIALCLFLLTAVFPVKAQKWQKAVDKTEKAYHTGKYDKAKKLNRKYQKKVQKKLGKTHHYLADYYILNNKINLAFGTLIDFNNEIELAFRLADVVKTTDFPYFVKIRRKVVELYLEYGNYVKAEEVLTQLEKDVAGARYSDPFNDTYLKYLKARTLAGKGFYTPL